MRTYAENRADDLVFRRDRRRVDRELLRHIGPARSEGVNFRGKLDFPLHQYQERMLSRKVSKLR